MHGTSPGQTPRCVAPGRCGCDGAAPCRPRCLHVKALDTPAMRAALQAGLTLREVSAFAQSSRGWREMPAHLHPPPRFRAVPHSAAGWRGALGLRAKPLGFWRTLWLEGCVHVCGGPLLFVWPWLSPHCPRSGPLLPSSGVLQPLRNPPPGVSTRTEEQAAGDPVPTRPGMGARPRPGQSQSLSFTACPWTVSGQSWTVVLAWGWIHVQYLFL